MVTRALARAHWRQRRHVYRWRRGWRRGWRPGAGAGAGRRGVLLLAQLSQPCEACVASARQPPILDAGATVVGAGALPAPRPAPVRIPAPGPYAPAPAPAPAPGPAETRPSSDTPVSHKSKKNSQSLPNFRFHHCPFTTQTRPSTAPEVYHDTACHRKLSTNQEDG